VAAPSVQATDVPRLQIVIDDRERASGLSAAVVALWPSSVEGRLVVGDVEIGPRVIIERKSLPDFVASIRDSRLFSQAFALSRVATRPLLLLEGTEPASILDLRPEQFHGVLLTLMLSFRVPVLRTSSVDESAAVIARIARHELRWLARRASPPRARPARQALDVLTSIPGLGDERARRLLREFGSVAGVVAAEPRDLQRVSGIGPETARSVRSALGPLPRAACPGAPPTPGSPPAPPST
jgi:Fanconi anemia group M protein